MSKPTKPTKATLEAQLNAARTKRQVLDKSMRQLEGQLRAQARQEQDRLALIIGPACAFKPKPTVSLCKKTVRGSMNLILISWTGFLIAFRPERAFGAINKQNEGYSDPRIYR